MLAAVGAQRCAEVSPRLDHVVKNGGVLQIGTTVMGVGDLGRAVSFWMQVLDYVPKRPVAADDDFTILVPRSGDGAHLALDLSETPVQQYPRVHLDLYAADQSVEVARLIGLGATRVDWDRYPPDPDFVVLADPEGNKFCVIDKS